MTPAWALRRMLTRRIAGLIIQVMGNATRTIDFGSLQPGIDLAEWMDTDLGAGVPDDDPGPGDFPVPDGNPDGRKWAHAPQRLDA
jgi:hypothetical protein